VAYREQITLAWALTWRLLLSNIILLLIVAMLIVAFGSPRDPGTGIAFFTLFFAMECLMAWPFVLRRTLPPQVFRLDARGFVLLYWPSVLFGVATDLLSVLPVLAVVLLSRLLGADLRAGGFISISVVTVRLFIVLPVLLGFVARRPVAS
jgi:hypothetical protein